MLLTLSSLVSEPVWRVAEKEWKDFIESFTEVLVGKDPQIPYLPPKDVIHRIYRDARFQGLGSPPDHLLT